MTNPLQNNSVGMPQLSQPAVRDDKTLDRPWYLLFRSLFDRTGGGNGNPIFAMESVADTATPVMMTGPLAFVQASGKSIELPQLNAGQWAVVVNKVHSQTLSVYPPPGGKINQLAQNAPYVMASVAKTTVQLFFYETPLQIWNIESLG